MIFVENLDLSNDDDPYAELFDSGHLSAKNVGFRLGHARVGDALRARRTRIDNFYIEILSDS